MRYTNALLVIGLMVMLCSCVSTGLPNFGSRDDYARAQVATELARDQYDVVLKDGKVTWWVNAENKSSLRTFTRGILTAQTNPLGIVEVEFSKPINANSKEKVGQENVIPKGDVPKEATIDPKKINCLLIPGVGCVTCTCAENCGGRRCKGIPANWPEKPLDASVAAQFGTDKVLVRTIPAPDLDVSIDGIEIDENGGKRFTWSVRAKNNEDKMIDLTIRTLFVTNTGEKESRDTIFILKPNEKRVIEGAPIVMKNRFRSVEGRSTVVGKKYVR